MQAYGGIENFERAVGVDPDNPVIPVILVVGGTFYVGYVHLSLNWSTLCGCTSWRSFILRPYSGFKIC